MVTVCIPVDVEVEPRGLRLWRDCPGRAGTVCTAKMVTARIPVGAEVELRDLRLWRDCPGRAGTACTAKMVTARIPVGAEVELRDLRLFEFLKMHLSAPRWTFSSFCMSPCFKFVRIPDS